MNQQMFVAIHKLEMHYKPKHYARDKVCGSNLSLFAWTQPHQCVCSPLHPWKLLISVLHFLSYYCFCVYFSYFMAYWVSWRRRRKQMHFQEHSPLDILAFNFTTSLSTWIPSVSTWIFILKHSKNSFFSFLSLPESISYSNYPSTFMRFKVG